MVVGGLHDRRPLVIFFPTDSSSSDEVAQTVVITVIITVTITPPPRRPPIRYITMLRDPVRRMMSWAHYCIASEWATIRR